MKRTFPFSLVLVFGFCLGGALIHSSRSSADEPGSPAVFSLGLATADITPTQPVRLSGYGARSKPSEGIKQRLFAKALAIGGPEEGSPVSLLLTMDAIGVPGWMSEALAERLKEKAGIERANLAVLASHTHSGPALKDSIPFIFRSGLTGEEEQVIAEHSDRVLDQLEAISLEAIGNRFQGHLHWGKGEASFAVNRRVLEDGIWKGFGHQEDGPVDHSLPLLRVTDTGGRLRGVFVNYACHCTTLGGDFNHIHGDWAGCAQEEIEMRHPEVVALVGIGCAADQNPNPRSTVADAERYGAEIADEVDRLLGTELKALEQAPRARYETIPLSFDPAPDLAAWKERAAPGRRNAHFAKAMVERLEAGIPLEETLSYPVQTWLFGEDLAMIFLAGEVVVDYAHRFYREFDAGRVWVNAYANDLPCYIPSKRLYPQGGYEVDSSMDYYGKPARLAIDTEERIASEVLRQMPHAFYSEETLARYPAPIPREEAAKTIEVPAGFEVELVAAEPLLMDPVDLAWGPDGKLWIVEMTDYPDGIDGKPGGRIRFLEDSDQDGTWDRSTLFADSLPFPNAVLPWRDGILVTTATALLFLRDTDGDGKSDSSEPLLTGLESGNPQHQLGGLSWGIDNWVYLANGSTKGPITSTRTGEVLNPGSRDLRFRPDTGKMEPASGKTQYGRNRDDWGNWFGCSNSIPFWHFALQDHYLRRNPHVIYPDPKKLLGAEPSAGPVYPVSLTLSRPNDYDKANRFTSACSLMPFRDVATGEEMSRSLFVAEPVHNLVSRRVLVEQGSSFEAVRSANDTASEFFASNDNWCRPVSIETGPDGALYILDMYRQVIEHTTWIPETWKRRMNVREGHDRGRLYRVRRKGPYRAVDTNLRALDDRALVERLGSTNGTIRDLAHRELLWRAGPDTVTGVADLVAGADSPRVRIQALAVLEGLDALTPGMLVSAMRDSDPRVRRQVVRLSEPFLVHPETSGLVEEIHALAAHEENAFVRQQIGYSLGESEDPESGLVLAVLLEGAQGDPYLEAACLSSLGPHLDSLSKRWAARWPSLPDSVVTGLLQTLIGDGDTENLRHWILALASTEEGDNTYVRKCHHLEFLLSRLTRPQPGITFSEQGLPLTREARVRALDDSSSPGVRTAAIRLLGFVDGQREEDLAALRRLVSAREPSAVRTAAIRRGKAMGEKAFAKDLLADWDTLGPSVRKELLGGLISRSSWTGLLLDEMESRPGFVRFLDASQRAALTNHRDAGLRERARALLSGPKDSSKEEILLRYASVFELSGDAERGAQHFATLCATCHRMNESGYSVGPDLNALTNRSTEALLTAIADPNEAIEEKYAMTLLETTDGRSFAGILGSESGSSLRLRLPGGVEETILRRDLASFTTSPVSLMPEGLDAALDPQGMADLIAYLRGGVPTVLLSGDGSLRLRPGGASFDSPGITHQTGDGILTGIRSGEGIQWRASPLPEGRYAVFFDAGLKTELTASASGFELAIGPHPVSGSIEVTGSPERLRKRQFGEIEIPEPLEAGTAIRFFHNLEDGVVSIREIALIPIR